jgi:hypothetical protein
MLVGKTITVTVNIVDMTPEEYRKLYEWFQKDLVYHANLTQLVPNHCRGRSAVSPAWHTPEKLGDRFAELATLISNPNVYGSRDGSVVISKIHWLEQQK